MTETELLILARYWIDDDHVWRYDTLNPSAVDEPRAVGYLGDGYMVSDAVEIALGDTGQPCDCGSDHMT